MAAKESPITALPNEIIISILSSFSTRELLSMTLVSHRFHALILRILQTRLFNAAGLKDHKLILECFHPSTKLSTPYLFCDYLGTGRCDAGSDELGFDGKSYNEGMGVEMGLGDLRGLYSHFRPLQPDEDRPRNRRHPAGGVLPNPSPFLQEREAEFVEQPINLESHELFSQLCTITNLVKVGPKRGLFLSCVNIGEGITRIWREWLGERARAGKRRERIGSGPNTKAEEEAESRKRLLWADAGSHVGLRIRVMECAEAAMPVLVGSDEDVAVSYTLQYEELVIRTTQLLLMVEQSEEQEVRHEHKAIVIGSWDT